MLSPTVVRGVDRKVDRPGVRKGADAFNGHGHTRQKQEGRPSDAAQCGDHRHEHPDEKRQEVGHVARTPGEAAPPVGLGVEQDLEDDRRTHQQGEPPLVATLWQIPPGRNEKEQKR